jgi:16S rRNA (uracil1498-N3)-methyltransferase
VAEPATTAQVADRMSAAALAIVLHEDAGGTLGGIELPAEGEIVVAVGPEGGVAPDELDAFAAAGARLASLGPTVLRTSTAGTVAVGVVLSRTARWR